MSFAHREMESSRQFWHKMVLRSGSRPLSLRLQSRRKTIEGRPKAPSIPSSDWFAQPQRGPVMLEADLQHRRPVWEALSELFLDTELQDYDFGFIARILAESG